MYTTPFLENQDRKIANHQNTEKPNTTIKNIKYKKEKITIILHETIRKKGKIYIKEHFFY